MVPANQIAAPHGAFRWAGQARGIHGASEAAGDSAVRNGKWVDEYSDSVGPDGYQHLP